MAAIEQHIERLRRHYSIAVATYDAVSLMDLSHTLRVWTELVDEAMKHPAFSTSTYFRSGSPHRRVTKAVKDRQYLISYLPPETTTYAHNGKMVSGSTRFESKTVSTKFMIDDDNGMHLRHVVVLSGLLPEAIRRFLDEPSIKRCSLKSWMGSEVVRYKYCDESNDLVQSAIARNVLIKRVANTMDGSHASIEGYEKSLNRFDQHLQFLMQTNAGGLPVPYFVLLNTAQAILARAGSYEA